MDTETVNFYSIRSPKIPLRGNRVWEYFSSRFTKWDTETLRTSVVTGQLVDTLTFYLTVSDPN